eukprot:m.161684 g.161684  ORF g.161684 m.161684 type:complete len:1227 (-) comp12106_c0_seq1:132-3812(-)
MVHLSDRSSVRHNQSHAESKADKINTLDPIETHATLSMHEPNSVTQPNPSPNPRPTAMADAHALVVETTPVLTRVDAILAERKTKWIDTSRILPALQAQYGTEAVTAARPAIEDAVKEHNSHVHAAPAPVAKAAWELTADAIKCPGCTQAFGYLGRKYNCRQCGRVYCVNCCSNYRHVSGYADKVRVCKSCNILLEGTDASLNVRKESTDKSIMSSILHPFGTSSSKDGNGTLGEASEHAVLKPRRSKTAEEEPTLDTMIPEHVGDRIALAMTVVSFFSPEYFETSTDPDGTWRKNELDVLLKAMELEAKRESIAVCMDSNDVSPLPLIEHFRDGGGNSLQVIQCYLTLTALHGGYDARARAVLCKLACHVRISRKTIREIERQLAQRIVQIAKAASEKALKDIEDQKRKSKLSRGLKIGAGAVVGGVLIGVTAGLAAPLVAVGAATAFGAGAGTALAGTTGAVTVGTLFGVGGARLVAQKSNKRFGGLSEFNFVKLYEEENSALSVVINVPGWCETDPSVGYFGGRNPYVARDFVVPVASADCADEGYTLVWESEKLHALSSAVTNFLTSQVYSQTKGAVLKATVLAGLMAALAVPSALMTASDLIDNPWSVCVEAANTAGIELANTLIKQAHGTRPVTLVGYSMGALVVVSAIRELARREDGRGIVQNVYLFGTPATGQRKFWDEAATAISGNIYNFLSTNDWFLKLMLRGLSIETCVAGLEGINHPRATNVDVSSLIIMHSDWAVRMPKLLQLAGLSTRYSNRPFVCNVGDRVRVSGKGEGILMFHGWLNKREPLLKRHPNASPQRPSKGTTGAVATATKKSKATGRPEYYGIALDKAVGDCDGSLEHGRYFECEANHGIFVPIASDEVELVEGRFSNPRSCYSSSCRRRRTDADGPVALCKCYAPICRADLGGLAKLSPRPDNNAMVDEDDDVSLDAKGGAVPGDGNASSNASLPTTKSDSSSWGFGRMLRAQRDAEAARSEGGTSLHSLDSIMILKRTAVTIDKCDTSLVNAAVYSITFKVLPKEGSDGPVEDPWQVQRTFTELSCLNDVLKVELGEDYARHRFPDALFSTANGRLPSLQAWLHDAVIKIPKLGNEMQEKAAFIVGVSVPQPEQDLTQSPPVGADGGTPFDPMMTVGSRVVVQERGVGTVRFLGLVRGMARVGVELDHELGLNDGTAFGHHYFDCKPNHGVFTKPDHVILLSEDGAEGGPTEDEVSSFGER